MTTRYLWTLERDGQSTRSGLDTVEEIISIIVAEDVPGAMPADWLVSFMRIDADQDGSAAHESTLGWTLRLQQMAA
ncbi:hypothetical protein B5K08_09455 [Rhizobium leguminosarum bv. trifolii]|uniref:Uncharacterized protein n=1 Tax=Rhizobium leguminosarum bv. trifolii TaxID=386 RepID=A0A3E1BTA2_RHILT|nr:hypothetical protein [Rhizobium leguminosarum]RFB96577.1 hypothetical protein B5K08_09455 [Rhizobium leguminosarum bv. trifolii]RFB96700.1 hypothetical protein B5K10_09440 [Rhizobium leguminosarum bv. trifolii]